MISDNIYVKGAKVHNLKNIDVKIPRNKLIVMTGLSGSGKSSLAFDTIYAEGQRRYVESLSAYARQFLGQMDKPDVEYIEGLSPAISIDQKTTSKNPRSTVGTVTEIYDYLRLLYARVGTVHCCKCGQEINRQSIDQIVDSIINMGEGTRLQILSPIIKGAKGEHTKRFEQARKSGYSRVRVDGINYDLQEQIKLEKNKKHDIDLVIDRIVINDNIQKRLTDSVETALHLSHGLVTVQTMPKDENQVSIEKTYSTSYACHKCDINVEELSPRMFSFNSPFGACPQCTGLGYSMKIDEDLVVSNPELSLSDGAINVSGWNSSKKDSGSVAEMCFKSLSRHYDFSLNTPFKDLPDKVKKVILYGSGEEKITFFYERGNSKGEYQSIFEGIVENLQRRYKESSSEYIKSELEMLMKNSVCPECKGQRLSKKSLAVRIGGKNIYELSMLTIEKTLDFFKELNLTAKKAEIAEQIIQEIVKRLQFLQDVGLSYLTLSRSSGTLSGGESQRIRLATQIGSSLTGVIYILDEPSIGLHQRDNDKLLGTLIKLRDIGNTVIVVEHDEDTIRAADYVIDIGPGAGVHGGSLVACGTVDDVLSAENSVTGQYLSGKKKIDIPKSKRKGTGDYITVTGAEKNNLKNINVKIPLGTLTCVTGVSGSGKSSLVNEILYKFLSNKLNGSKKKADGFKEIKGYENLDKIIAIDQSPIGRTPRSNPATYTGLFADIRELFASTNQAKMQGYSSGRFSFNIKGGRCESCQGDGIIKIEMHFLPDVYVECEVCKGKRYNRETLDITYKDKNIADVLNMTVEEGEEFFKNIPKIHRKLKVLREVGLGYIKIGQPSTTLSGGEAQRIKLASELNRKSTGKTMYIMDEPSTGLHIADVHKLIDVTNTLVENGNTVLVIEHNLDIIKVSDYIIDIGPEGGEGGGQIVYQGPIDGIFDCNKSYTGAFLKKHIDTDKSI